MADKHILQWSSGRLDFSNGCIVMGVLNVTPDSFSDGGLYLDCERAVDRALQMQSEGAGIIDIGAESTRPGSAPVPAQQQIERAVPVIRKLSGQLDIPVSIDTSDPCVAGAALDAGASLINDVNALRAAGMSELVCRYAVPVILMHMKGSPETMQTSAVYEDVVAEVRQFLLERAAMLEKMGVDREMIFIDPGIGFGKTHEHNLMLLKYIEEFVQTGYKVLAGTSRKSFLGALTSQTEPSQRMAATAATVAWCAQRGCSVVRVHDVGEMVDVVKVIHAVNGVRQ